MHFQDLPKKVQQSPLEHLVTHTSPATTSSETSWYFDYTFSLDDQPIGNGKLLVNNEVRRVFMTAFYPHRYLQGGQGKGIGTLANLGMYRALDKQVHKIQDYAVEHNNTSERLGHLKTVGFPVDDLMSGETFAKAFRYSDYVSKLRKYSLKKGYLAPGKDVEIDLQNA